MIENKFYVINEDGIRVDARILSKFRLANANDYIVYSLNELNEEGMIKIYVTGLVSEGGNYSSREITTDEEWNNLKSILKTLAKDEEEPFQLPANISFEIFDFSSALVALSYLSFALFLRKLKRSSRSLGICLLI